MPALHGEAVVVDAARGTLVLVGGRTSRGWLAGTWEWDGQHWRRTETMRRRDALPAGRGGSSLVHDARNGRLLYFGGYNERLLADLWALDARGWRQLPR